MKNLPIGRKTATRKRPTSKITLSSLRFGIRADKQKITAVREAMIPETRAGKRSDMHVEVSKNGKELVLTIVSKDLTSLRASLNTNLRLVYSALKTLDAAELVS